MLHDRRILTPRLFVLATAIALGCRDAPLAENVNSNMPPLANAGGMQTLEDTGGPVRVMLDGSESSDPDGEIVGYRWLSANRNDGGPGRAGPDPDDVARPRLTLEAGVWSFLLYVFDDDGGVSQPSTVTITIGSEVPPEVTECVDTALEFIAEDCRSCVCGLSEMCRTALANCGQPCWDFYGCVQNQCAEFIGDQAGLANCVRGNCSAFFGGVGQYMPLESCLMQDACSEPCASSVRDAQ